MLCLFGRLNEFKPGNAVFVMGKSFRPPNQTQYAQQAHVQDLPTCCRYLASYSQSQRK